MTRTQYFRVYVTGLIMIVTAYSLGVIILMALLWASKRFDYLNPFLYEESCLNIAIMRDLSYNNDSRWPVRNDRPDASCVGDAPSFD